MTNKITLWALDSFSLVAIVGTAILVGAHWAALPARIPTHFDASGRPNGEGSRETILVLLFLGFILYAVLSIAARYQRLINLPIKVDRSSPVIARRLREMLSLLKLVVSLSICFIIWTIIRVAQGNHATLTPVFVPALVAANLAIVLFYVNSLKKEQGKL